jgi:hypothetical protein
MNIYKILETLAKVEAANPAQQAAIAKKKSKEKPKSEGSMADAAHNPSGAKFGGYWKGTDPNPPKPGMGVGGCEEDVDLEEELRQSWDQYLKEFGADNSQPQQQTQQDKAALQKQTDQAMQNIQRAKTGLDLPSAVSPSAAAKSSVAIAKNPKLTNNPTGAGMDPETKKLAMTSGEQLSKFMATATPSQVQQLSNVMKQASGNK